MSAMHDPVRRDDADPAEGQSPLQEAPLPEIEPGPDFLAGVQSKLHTRSGGKFYRSRWSTTSMSTVVQIVSLAMLLLSVLIWLLSGPVVSLGPDQGGPAAGQGDGELDRPPVRIRIQGPEPGSPDLPSPPPLRR
jgi:hypothetical protein